MNFGGVFEAPGPWCTFGVWGCCVDPDRRSRKGGAGEGDATNFGQMKYGQRPAPSWPKQNLGFFLIGETTVQQHTTTHNTRLPSQCHLGQHFMSSAETVFGQSIFGHPDLTVFGHFWPVHFWPSCFGPGQFWPKPILANPILAVVFWAPPILAKTNCGQSNFGQNW